MGRMKVFLRAFCLDRKREEATNENSFNQIVDVSHLATPHISSNLSLALRSSANSTPNNETNNGQDDSVAICSNIQDIPPLDPHNRRLASESSGSPNPLSFNQQRNDDRLQSNVYEPEPSQSPQNQVQQQSQHQQPTPQRNLSNHQVVNHQRPVGGHEAQAHDQDINGSAKKLSYDIISVREPLAKILADRQQLPQQRQILGDHEYIEVYGDRGSSCFYEEIAGSTTSSATYDQIGGPSNHNYQVLVSAYAGANRLGIRSDPIGEEQNNSSNDDKDNNSDHDAENVYDITHPSDQVDTSKPSTGSRSPSSVDPQPSTSGNTHEIQPNLANLLASNDRNIMSQSIPVYSVINKATRRSNAIIRATAENCRPPQPPPKNLSKPGKTSTSATQLLSYQELASTNSHRSSPAIRISPQVPTTSSYSSSNNILSDFNETDHHSKLPQPPPRYSKHPMLNATKRPLPLPESPETKTNGIKTDQSSTLDEDIYSIDNGYELLNSNFDDDQIDVGYEKIRESNRYSGGSLSSQICTLPGLDNGGYESVHPIYSSPSNALAEPNYEAIGPATASELAAAATARLTAAAAVIEQLLKKDSNKD